MRALTIHMPYAELIANGSKTIEMRKRKTNILNEPILICAGRKKDYDIHHPFNYNPRLIGHALCVVEIINCRQFENNIKDWKKAGCLYKMPEKRSINTPYEFISSLYDNKNMPSLYAWELKLLYKIKPFKVLGKQGFFKVKNFLIKKL